jgi:PKD repeat protein
MFKKSLSTPSFLLVLFLFQSSLALGQSATIRFKTLRASEQEDVILKEQFSSYTLATLGTAEIAEMLRSKPHFQELTLEFDDQSFTFSLTAHDIRAPHYKLRAMTDQGVVEFPRSPNKTYFGYTHHGNKDVRITADEDFFYSMILQGNDELYIEPVRHILKGAPKNQFVIYWASNNLKKFNAGNCGVHETQTPVFHDDSEHKDQPDENGRERACKVVEIALADDFEMFQEYGSVPEVEDHNMAVINNVLTNYDFEFDDDMQFDIVEIYVAATNGQDPWTNSTDPGALLDDFTDWAPSGFDNDHDMGSLWSARNFNGDVIGLAWLSAVCTNFGYCVLEDFTSNANLLRVLQAHEMGHNFSANHDPTGSNTIMAPSVSNTNNWSNASINSIDNYMNSAWCLGPCGAPLPPVADFQADETQGCVPMVVHFDDQSDNNPTSWSWSFEGGTPPTSTQQNPTVTYNSTGTFNVSLTVTNAQGSNTKTILNYITVEDIPLADFDYSIDEFEVDFENLSSGATDYDWSFGDGGTSTLENPLHVYAEDGVYTVTLSASNDCGTDVITQVIEIITQPFADFSSNVDEGCVPFEVEFYNLSSENADEFEWEFPGGSPPTSTAFEPIVLYEVPGSYPVTLTVFNEAGEDQVVFTNYITVYAEPFATFTYSTNGLQVNFNSQGSTGDTYSWAFGDGGTSSATNPSHTYPASGVYQVTLTVANDCGNDVIVIPVTVTGAPDAGFSSNQQSGCAPLVVQFTNQSGGSPTSFAWIFEGGTPGTSNVANPLVTYNTPGTFDVQLTVTNATGSDVLMLPNYITVAPPTVSDFDVAVNGNQALFANQSSNYNSSSWDFGDGQTSTDEDPTHIYNVDGTYTVTLIASGVCGNDTSTAQVTIQTPPSAGFSAQSSGECVPVSVQYNNESSSNATSFLWSFPGGNPSSSTAENPVVSYSTQGTYSATLIAFSAAGSDTATFNNVVVIGDVPDADFLLSTDETTVTLNNESGDAESYFWFFGDGETSTDADPIHTYASFGTYTIMLIATNSCGNDTSEVVIELSTIPNAFFSYSDHSGCAPFVVNFIDQSQNNPTEWLWNFEGGDPATSTLQNPSVTYTIPGTYSVSLQATNGQGTDVLLLNGLIQVGGTPDATFHHEQTENVVSLEYQGLDYDSLHWDFGDGRTDNSLNPTVEYSVSGQYLISLIVYNPCGTDTSSVWVTITIVSTDDPAFNPSIWQIRPNPFHDVFSIYGEPATSGDAIISLFDVRGRLMSEESWSYQSGPSTKEINGVSFPDGVILVVIRDPASRTVLKAVKQ